MKILIVDDEVRIREVVKEYAKVSGYEIDEASNGKVAIEMVKKTPYDCVILDIMMPELDGFSACKKIKEINEDISIIMLSARQEDDDKIYGFDIGADDYVTKPFSPKELMRRIKLICDRKQKVEKEKLVFDTLVIDVTGRDVFVDDKRLDLTPKEFELLLYLAKNKGIALDRNKILRNVWEVDFYGDDRTVDTHIKMLRKNLGEKYRDCVVTVRGMGYKFEI